MILTKITKILGSNPRLDIVTPSTAFSALARMHYPLDDPQKVLVDAKELLQILARSLGQRCIYIHK